MINFDPLEVQTILYKPRSPRSNAVHFVKHSGYWWKYTWRSYPLLNTWWYRDEPDIEVFDGKQWLRVLLGDGSIPRFLKHNADSI